MTTDPDDLKDRIAAARAGIDRESAEREVGTSNADDNRSMGVGLRVGLEFASAVIMGIVLGLAVDHWLGTKPFGLLTFMVLGFAAGLLGLKRLMDHG